MYDSEIVARIRKLYRDTDQDSADDHEPLSAADFLEEVGLLLNQEPTPPILAPWNCLDDRRIIKLTEVEAESLIASGLAERCDSDYCGRNILHPNFRSVTFDFVAWKLDELRAAVKGE